MTGRKPPAAPRILKKDMYDALVVVLDCGVSMNDNETSTKEASSFEMAREAADWIISRKIFTRASDRINIVCCGTEDEKNDVNVPHVTILDEVLNPAKFDHLRFLLNEIELSGRCSNVINGLIVALDNIRSQTNGDAACQSRGILLLTNGKGDASDSDIGSVTAALKAMGINLVIMGLDEEDVPGTSSTVLRQLVANVEGDTYSFRDACSALHHFTQPQVNPRALRKNWEIAPGLKLPLAMYMSSVEAKNPLKSVLVNNAGEQMQRERRIISNADVNDVASGSAIPSSSTTQSSSIPSYSIVPTVASSDLPYAYHFGSSKIVLSKEDEEAFNGHNFNEGEERGCLKLLQFVKSFNVPKSFISGHNSYIALPGWEKKTSHRDESLCNVTLSLIKTMLEENVVAICRYAANASSNIQIMGLFPVEDETGQLFMTAMRLPFADDWRPFTLPDLQFAGVQPTEGQLDLVDELIDSLTIPENDTSYESVLNPFFQRKCSAMKLLALSTNSGNVDESSVAPSVFLKRGLEPNAELLQNAREVLNAMVASKREDGTIEAGNGFLLEPVIKKKREQRNFIPDNKDYLMGEESDFEDDVPEGGAEFERDDIFGREVMRNIRSGDIASFLKFTIGTQLTVWDSKTNNENIVKQYLTARSIVLEEGLAACFNQFLFQLVDKLGACTDYFISNNIPGLISTEEDITSPYSSLDSLQFWEGMVLEAKVVKDEPFQ